MANQPQYYGLATHLGEHPGLEADQYFFVTPVGQWSLKHFFKTHNDHTLFIDGLVKISSRKTVDRAIRSYACAWVGFLGDEMGKLRLEAFRTEAATDITNDIIVNEERYLAQQKLRKRLGEQTVHLQRPRAEKGERVVGGPNTMKSATHANNPFQSETSHDDDDDEDEEEEEVATLVQEQGHRPLNVVFDYEAFAFSCIIGYYDISAPFNDYYEEAIATPYDRDTFQDFLATAGILFLGKEPTNMQRRHFGERFERLREVMVEMIQPNKDDEQARADEEDGAVAFCQAARN
ncbi:hypothetical protein BGZ54_002017, partial [Gamsiella multidivaricata]